MQAFRFGVFFSVCGDNYSQNIYLLISCLFLVLPVSGCVHTLVTSDSFSYLTFSFYFPWQYYSTSSSTYFGHVNTHRVSNLSYLRIHFFIGNSDLQKSLWEIVFLNYLILAKTSNMNWKDLSHRIGLCAISKFSLHYSLSGKLITDFALFMIFACLETQKSSNICPLISLVRCVFQP